MIRFTDEPLLDIFILSITSYIINVIDFKLEKRPLTLEVHFQLWLIAFIFWMVIDLLFGD